MNKFKKLIIPALLSGMVASPMAMAHGSFDGHDVNVKFEMWKLDTDKNVAEVLAVRNEQDITASDTVMPDAKDFHAMDKDFHLWDIDFKKGVIDLTFTSITVQDHDNQYMYMNDMGFHFSDTTDNLSDILHVTVDDRYAPSAYNKGLIRHDADNIHLNLQGSMCHVAGMAGMPECSNTDSPTGYSNIIKLDVLFANSADALFDWGEEEYPEFFMGKNAESFYILGYYARQYKNEETGKSLYMGTKDGNLYIYDENVGEIVDYGAMGLWIAQLPEDEHSDACPEGQHMMNGQCMANHEPAPETCPEGQHMMNGQCMANEEPKTCAEGEHMMNGQCMANEEPKTCPEGQHMMSGGVCMNNDGTMPETEPTTCPEGQHMMGGQCMANH